MTLQNKIAINNMRLEGHSPSAIAAVLGLPAGTVRAHIHRYPEIPNTKLCKNCGKPVLQTEKRREKMDKAIKFARLAKIAGAAFSEFGGKKDV